MDWQTVYLSAALGAAAQAARNLSDDLPRRVQGRWAVRMLARVFVGALMGGVSGWIVSDGHELSGPGALAALVAGWAGTELLAAMSKARIDRERDRGE